jgi:hypothetical protein
LKIRNKQGEKNDPIGQSITSLSSSLFYILTFKCPLWSTTIEW